MRHADRVKANLLVVLALSVATGCGISDPSRAASGSSRGADDPIVVVARAHDGRLWAPAAGAGPARDRAPAAERPVFVTGVNFGVALPGRWPSEFPEDEANYAGWLDLVAEMGANTVRAYTLLPPAFYSALEKHNRTRPRARLWLLQGVWTELPGGDNYHEPAFLDGFKDEIRRVIDAVHGDLDLAPRPGHASGRYRADVSGSVLGWVLGREWEPYSVRAYDQKRGGEVAGAPERAASFHGEYMVVDRGTPFEAWLAGVLDFTVAHETARYRVQRPVSFVSWPTLDPMTHPTEATVAEEKAWRRRRGEDVSGTPILEYDNDGVTVDPTRIRPTAAAGGGLFATYHAYPYYPDFMHLDTGYCAARGARGPSCYLGYLRDLRAHHGDLPIVIGEFGVPSSRGLSHYHPQGWHHGGHSERDQAHIDALLMRDIHEAGMAGGVVFALLDEWFKRNWLVAEFEAPADRNPLWLNVLDPEQNYGILAARPGATGWKVTIDGRGEDWATIPPLMTRAGAVGPERPAGDGHDAARVLRGLRVASDEAYLYVRLDVDDLDADDDGRPEWERAAYTIGIDTHDDQLGDHRMPLRDTLRSPAGLEFCVILDGPGTARLLVDTPYDLHTHRYHRPYHSVKNDDGRYTAIRVETNRRRIGRDGQVHPARDHNRSPLLHASMDARDADYDSRADWRVARDGTFIEMRLAWGLLNVTDPSSRRVLHDDPANLKMIGTRVTPGFRFFAASYRPAGAAGGHTPMRGRWTDRLPAGDGARASDLPIYAWPTWNQPTWRIEKKEVWSALRDTFADLVRQEAAK